MRPVSDKISHTSNGDRQYTNGSSTSTNGNKAYPYATNGFSHANGSSPESHTNGLAKGKSKDQKYFGHDREEITRLLIQALGDLGYDESANSLVRESGVDLESPVVAALRHAVLNGEWSEAEALLFGIPEQGLQGSSLLRVSHKERQGLPLADGVDRDMLLFKLRRQKYLELLEKRDQSAALVSLQTELTPLHRDTAQLHFLSGLMVSPSTEDLKLQAGWDGAHGSSRRQLLSELAAYIAPSVMIPSHRLAVLLDQVQQSQIAACDFHDPMSKLSLFSDHMCDNSQLPLQSMRRIPEAGEIWYLAFSPDGKWLATCGSSHAVTVYATENFEEEFRLDDHSRPVAYLAWSPDSSKIVSCSQDNLAKIWEVQTEHVITTIVNHNEPVSSAVWLPDGSSFITGALDSRCPINTWNSEGGLEYKWPASHRSQHVAISPDGERLVSISNDREIFVYSLRQRLEEFKMRVAAKLTCVTVSNDSRYILVNLGTGELQLIDLDARAPVRKYVGLKQGEFIIRSTFGGVDQNLVISGSEDGKVYVFNRERGTVIDALDDHAPAGVNAIAWHPGGGTMFASGGDDRCVRIWAKPQSRPSSLRKNSDASGQIRRSSRFASGVSL